LNLIFKVCVIKHKYNVGYPFLDSPDLPFTGTPSKWVWWFIWIFWNVRSFGVRRKNHEVWKLC